MRLVIQRVNNASVSVRGEVVGSIKKGLFILVGVKNGDTQSAAFKLAEKVAKMRVMADKEGKMNETMQEAGGSILVVSQFTLYADTSGGNRPSFITAAKPEVAQPVYEAFVNELKLRGVSVKTGRFGEYMKISLELDGPVTIILDS